MRSMAIVGIKRSCHILCLLVNHPYDNEEDANQRKSPRRSPNGGTKKGVLTLYLRLAAGFTTIIGLPIVIRPFTKRPGSISMSILSVAGEIPP